MQWKRFILGSFLGALMTTIIGSFISTHRIIEASMPLNETYAAQIDIQTRLNTMISDLIAFGPLFLIFVFIAFLISMAAAIYLSQKKPTLTLPIFLGAGFVAILIMLRAMKFAFFNVDIVAGARDITGYVLIALAGLIGAFVFYRIYRRALLT